jgi:putative ABC transport system permease protein
LVDFWPNYIVMFKNYFKMAFRNLLKNKSFSAINILGLAIGLAVCLLITLFVIDELSYDSYNVNADRIYRVSSDFNFNGTIMNKRESPAHMATDMTNDYPQIELATRLRYIGETLVKKGTQTIAEPNTFYGDANMFKVFTLPFISGDANTALTEPQSIVISEDVAKKYFNTTDVVGKTIHLDNAADYKITGLIKNTPQQSHLHFNIIKAMSGFEQSRRPDWMAINVSTYIMVKPGITQHDLDGYLKIATKKYAEPQLVQFAHSTIADLESKGGHFKFATIPLTKIHLYSNSSSEVEPSGNVQHVYIFIIIAVIILLIACINFMNLSTARSAGRAREVGVRKVLGSNRWALIYQFLIESTLTAFIALVIALTFATLLLPYFNAIAHKQIELNFIATTWLMPGLLSATVIIGLMAGLYPAFFMSAFMPAEVLKGKLATGFKGSVLRNGLVVFQFTTVIILIIGTLVIYSQLNYIRNKNLGYNREQVLVVKNTYALNQHANSFKQDVLKLSGVQMGTLTSVFPTDLTESNGVYSKDAAKSPGEAITVSVWNADEDYIPTLGMKMAAGRNFSKDHLSDSTGIVINEAAAALLGFKNPLNKKLYQGDDMHPYVAHIIGVVKDFNFGSLRNRIKPLVLRLGFNRGSMAFRVNTKNLPALVSKVEKLYHSADANAADQPFEYSFMDDDFNHIYQSEQNMGKIFICFAFFAILIACLGLFGLVTYAAERRTKEIGIRKVLGASVANIVNILSTDFLKLVAIAVLVAFPIAWYAMNNWLQGFAYRTAISWWVFIVAGILAIIITMATVSFRAIKAALANPVKSLKNE